MEILTQDEMAERLRISRQKLSLMTRRGEVPALHMGRAVRYIAEDVMRAVLDAAQYNRKPKLKVAK